MKFNVCFILGGPGAGKGTVCERIVKEYGFMHLSAGELLRQARDSPDSEFADCIQTHMKNGTIVPAEITCNLLHQAMIKGYQSQGCEHFLIDGFPRNDDNRTCWEKEMGSKTQLKRVIVLECSEQCCIERCLHRGSGRVDDNEKTLQLRIKQFKDQCIPVIRFYEDKNLVSRIDANGTREEVFDQVRHVMTSLKET